MPGAIIEDTALLTAASACNCIPDAELLQNPSDGLFGRMVVVHRALGFRFVIYTLDHEPAHVHVTGSGQAKINLLGADGKPEMIESIGIKRADIRRLMAQAIKHQTHFLAEWEKIHGSKD